MNNSVELLAHVLWCMCVCVCVCVIFPMTHTQEWDDWVIDFHCLQLYWIIVNCSLNYHSNFTPILSVYVLIYITSLRGRFI